MAMAKVVTVVCMALVLMAGAGITATAAERAASVTASFGPVIERKIAFVSGKANSCLNLDSGAWVDVGKAASLTELRKTGAQLYRSGIQSNLNDLVALEVYLIPLEDKAWDTLSAADLVVQYQLDERTRKVVWRGEAFFHPGTYLFYTGNNLGLLQVLPLVPGGALDGVAVRYRLVQQGPSATQPSAASQSVK